MGYKLLGLVVWRGGKWYLQRRFPGAARKAAIGAVATIAVAGIAAGVAVARKGSDES